MKNYERGLMVTNKEIFEEFYHFCKNKNMEEVIREYGGDCIYIPSYKRVGRDKKIYQAWKKGVSLRSISKRFNLSLNRVRQIVKKQDNL
jgi:Mor family transcriptional regulator